MKYENLQELIRSSSSSRRYFLSLPVETQLLLHSQSEYIHSAEELHRRALGTEACHKQVMLSEFFNK